MSIDTYILNCSSWSKDLRGKLIYWGFVNNEHTTHKTGLFKKMLCSVFLQRKMYVWEYPNYQNLDGERRILLLIQSLSKKIISWMAQKHRQSSLLIDRLKFSESLPYDAKIFF